MKKAASVCIALLGVVFCLGFGVMDSSAAQTGSDKGKETPTAAYGALRVQGRNLVNVISSEKIRLLKLPGVEASLKTTRSSTSQ